MVLNFQEEIPLSENVAQVIGGPLRRFVAVGRKRRRDFPPQTGGEPDQAVGVPGQQVLINARPVIEALRVSRRSELHQIAVTSLVLAKNQQEIRTVGVLSLVEPVWR